MKETFGYLLLGLVIGLFIGYLTGVEVQKRKELKARQLITN